MNFCGYIFDSDTQQMLENLTRSGRLPHAVIIEGKSEEKNLELATLLSAYAVCESDEKPCGKCRQCSNALAKSHADITYVEPEKSGKTKTYKIDQIRELAKDAQIRPNDANAKVYIFQDAGRRFSEVSQNAFLKLLEEPPQNICFFLLCHNAKALLGTVRSRCTVIRTGGSSQLNEDSVKAAKEIISGIISTHEYDLLKALSALTDKDRQSDILTAVRLILRDALAILSGSDAVFDSSLARRLAAKLTRGKIIEMIELTDSSDYKLKQNININLLTTWLCGEYRRILWQR